MSHNECGCGALKRSCSLRCDDCYRAAQRVVKRCGECGITKPRTEYAQRRSGEPKARCQTCASFRQHRDRREVAEVVPARVRAIVAEVAEWYELDPSLVMSRCQQPHLAAARRWAWVMIRHEMRIGGRPPSYPQIGRWFGRDHTTVLIGCRIFQEAASQRIAA